MKRVLVALLAAAALITTLFVTAGPALAYTTTATFNVTNNADGTATVKLTMPTNPAYGTMTLHETYDSDISGILGWLQNPAGGGQVTHDIWNGTVTAGQVITFTLTIGSLDTNFTGWRMLAMHGSGTGYSELKQTFSAWNAGKAAINNSSPVPN